MSAEHKKQPVASRHSPLPLRRMAREWALQYLYQLDVAGEEMTDQSLEWFWRQQQQAGAELGAREWRKCRETTLEMVRGVLTNKDFIDQKINAQATNWDLGRMAAIDRNILRLAVYEICFEAEIPPPVSINEALEICKTFGDGEESTGFINGILDNIHKESSPEAD